MIGTHAFFLWNVRDRIVRADPDFTAFYTAGEVLREGRGAQLYDAATQQSVQRRFATDSDIRHGPLPYIHPPFEALLFIPLALLCYRDAFLTWEALNVGMLFGIAWILRRSLKPLQSMPLWEWVLALLAFFPIFANFLQGQDGILLLLFFVLAFRAFDRNAELTAGWWLGLGVFRFHLVVPLVLILGLWSYRRIVLGFAATASGALVVSAGIVGWQGFLHYPAYAWHWASTPFYGRMPPSLMPNLLGLATGWSAVERVKFPLQVAVVAASVALLVVVGKMQNSVTDLGTRNLSFGSAVIAAVLAGYNTGSYDLCLLVLPLALVGANVAEAASESRRARTSIIWPAIPLLVSPLWFLLWRRWEKINLMALFLLWWLFAIQREVWRLKQEAGAGTEAVT